MKALFLLSKRQPPSARLRISNCIPAYEAAGVECTVLPIPSGPLGRLGVLRAARAHDVVVIQKKTSFHGFELKALRAANPRLVFDLDDAVMFHELEHHKPLVGKHFMKFCRTVSQCAAVVAGNAFLAQFARPNCPRVAILPTPVDMTRYRVRDYPERPDPDAPVVVGWLGVRSNLHYLESLAPVFRRLAEAFPTFRLKIVSNGFIAMEGVPIIEQRWSLEGELEMLRSMDVGIMPLNDSLWSQGKCGYKLLQYMGAGVPVVGSPVGINREFVVAGVNGFLASDHEQWYQALRQLVADGEKRKAYGLAGFDLVNTRYSQARYQERYLALLREVAEMRSGARQEGGK